MAGRILDSRCERTRASLLQFTSRSGIMVVGRRLPHRPFPCRNVRVIPSDHQTTPVSPTTPVPPRPRSRFWSITLQLTICWVVYVLSIGPLYWQWYMGKYVNGPTVIAALYEPLWQLCGLFPPLGWFVNWYVRFWIL